MTRFFVAAALALTAWCGPAFAATGDQDAVRNADQALLAAIAGNDTSALGRLTDAQFSFTDSDGKTSARADVLRAVPRAADQRGMSQAVFVYGRVAMVRSNRDNVHALRIFVKRKRDWQALVYHEVTVNPASATAPAAPAQPGVAPCDNPCKTLPYKPRNAAERDMLRSWQALEIAVSQGIGAAWAPHAADEFVVVNNSRLQDKAARVAAVNLGGASPPPLVTAVMDDFDDAIVMIADHQPENGKPTHVSRIWVKRGGMWQMAVSFQNFIQAAPARIK